MSQYRTGTVAVTNGSQTVTGTGTAWLASITQGMCFAPTGDNASYQISQVVSDGSLTLSAPYGGTTRSGAAYAITKGFTPIMGFPIFEPGDIDTPTLWKRLANQLENALADAYTGLGIAKENFGNRVLNGDFRIWQRGTSFATPASGSYTADRALVLYDGTIGTFTVSRQAHTVGQTAVPGEPRYFWRWDQTAAGSGSTFRRPHWRMEDVRTLAGQNAVVSFYAKADAARTITPKLRQNFGTGGSPSASVDTALTGCSLTTSFQKFTRTVAVPSISGKTLGSSNNDFLDLFFELPLNTTMTIDISDIDVRVGSSAPAVFERRPLDLETQLCERFFQKSFAVATAPAQNVGAGTGEWRVPQVVAASTSQLLGRVGFRTRMRAAPTITLYNPAAANSQARNIATATDCTLTATEVIDESGFSATATTPAATAAGQTLALHWQAAAEL
jgi:hypothetical protein